MRRAARPLLAGAEPFEYPGRPEIGALLVHGFTGTPREMRPVGAALAEAGIGSIGVLLRGHGTHPDDMLGYRYTDWIEDVEAGLARLLERHERAVLIGLSMGGTLALNVAARHAADRRVAGLVTLAATLRLHDWRLGLAGILTRLVKWQGWGQPSIKDRSAWDGHLGYRRFRTRSVLELLALMTETRARLADVTQPILIVHARADRVVPPANATLVYEGVSSPDREIIFLDNCYHVVTVDYEAAQVNARIVQFVERLSA